MTQILTVPAEPVEGGASERRIVLVRALLGFPASRAFALTSLGDVYAPFQRFQSLDEPALEFVVVAPGALFSDYAFTIDDADVELLGLRDKMDVEVLVLVTVLKGASPTVNLMGPLVINRQTDTASQVVLQDGRYAVAVPVDAATARWRPSPADPASGA